MFRWSNILPPELMHTTVTWMCKIYEIVYRLLCSCIVFLFPGLCTNLLIVEYIDWKIEDETSRGRRKGDAVGYEMPMLQKKAILDRGQQRERYMFRFDKLIFLQTNRPPNLDKQISEYNLIVNVSR